MENFPFKVFQLSSEAASISLHWTLTLRTYERQRVYIAIALATKQRARSAKRNAMSTRELVSKCSEAKSTKCSQSRF
jgi:hypothetical protein